MSPADITRRRNQTPLLLLFLILLLPNRTSSDPRAKQAALICSNQTAPSSTRQQFVSNFISALDALTPQIASSGYGSSQTGSILAFSQCLADLSSQDCDLCFALIKAQIQQCLPYQRLTLSGSLFFDGCYLRYASANTPPPPTPTTTLCGPGTAPNRTLVREIAVELGRNLTLGALKLNSTGSLLFATGYLTRNNLTIYGLAQCWHHLANASDCSTCLADAASSAVNSCNYTTEARVMNGECYFRYAAHKFYNNTLLPPSPPSRAGRGRSVFILATVLSSLALLMLLVGAFFGGIRFFHMYTERNQLGKLFCTMNKSKLHFAYEVLEEATDYFHESNKLGQGGCGSVYKGRLPDGTPVAVKRLFFNTRQWVDHFFNEVNIISSIQHENLVKLLGCSITGPESLLVYEFVANQSLHDHLFGTKIGKPLSWENRCKLILGTAKGLAYLHEESGYRIIHRDIKLGNVLVDENYTAKIADFGLVRLLPEDQSHLTTVIAGTLGYMAPEYIVCGMLTEKADIYSFGVVLIEIISGKRNNSITEDSVCMLHTIWDLYVKRRIIDAIDKALEDRFKEEEASRLLLIGLLCVQANAELRPPMSLVVKMISDKGDLPEPTQPPYLNSSSGGSSRQTRTEGSDSHSASRHSSSSDGISESSWMNPR